jgi:hypothetical protein
MMRKLLLAVIAVLALTSHAIGCGKDPMTRQSNIECYDP